MICMCADCFHSVGTGSGIGTKILEILKDEFPDVYRYVHVHVGVYT